MRLTLATLLIALIAALPVSAAEERLDAEAFERYTTGQTLSFSVEGVPYGVEQYLPGRRVLWAFIGDACQEGVWYAREGLICFIYDATPGEQCWSFYRTDNGLRAVFEGPEGPSTELYEVGRSTAPLTCTAPGLGV